MALPRYLFGSGASDFAIAPPSRHGGFVVSAPSLGNGTLWSAKTGGIQYTDLQTVDGGAKSTVSTDEDGSLVPFYGPAGVDSGWLDFGFGSRVFISSSVDADSRVTDLVSSPGTAARAALDSAVGSFLGSASATRTAADSAVGAFIGSSSTTRDAGDVRWQRQLNVVDAATFGVVADGVTDDRAALLSALAAAKIVVLPVGAGICLSSKVIIPAGVTLITRGTPFVATTATGDFLVRLTDNVTVIGGLVVKPLDAANVRGVEVIGSGISVDRIAVSVNTNGIVAGDANDVAVGMTGVSGSRFGSIEVTNFDYPVKLDGVSDTVIGRLKMVGYVRGAYIKDCTDLTIESGAASTASPNAAVAPGHNAILIESVAAADSTRDITIRSFDAADSGEHGYRMGGSLRASRVRFIGCTARNVGASGFKVLGDTASYHEDITFTDCVVEDAGQTTANCAGFMIQYARRVKVNGPIIRKKAKTFSVDEGINVNGAEYVVVNDPDIDSTQTAGFAVRGALGGSTGIKLNGGRITATSGACVHIDYTGVTMRRISVEGWPQLEVGASSYAVRIVNTSGGAVVGTSWLCWQSVSAAANQVDPAAVVVGWAVDVRAAFSAVPTFRAGSRWVDAGTTRYSTGSAWRLDQPSGVTGSRPTTTYTGQVYYDTTLGKPIWWNGTAWKDAAGTTV